MTEDELRARYIGATIANVHVHPASDVVPEPYTLVSLQLPDGDLEQMVISHELRPVGAGEGGENLRGPAPQTAAV